MTRPARWPTLAAVAAACLCVPAATGQDKPPAFGFQPMEVYKVGWSTGAMRMGDVNGDGYPDIVIANNDKVKIEILEQVKPGEKADAPAPEGPNDPGSDRRFRRESLPVSRTIKALVVADWNGDGLSDLAWYTDPPELAIALRTKTGWSTPATFPIKDGPGFGTGMVAADLNGDGLRDLILLGKGRLHILKQKSAGVFAPPETLPTTEEELGWLFVADVNGDKRPDLVLGKTEDEAPLRIRIGTATGFRPEVTAVLGAAQALEVADIGRGPADEIFLVEQRTGRLRVLAYAEGPAAGLGSPQFLPLPLAKQARDRAITVGDVDGDGRADIVVAEQKATQLTVYRQDTQGTFARYDQYPTFNGVTDVAIADVTGDGKSDVVVCSPVERAIGIHQWTDGRLAFATAVGAVGTLGKPLAVAVCDADGKAPLDLAVAIEEEKKKRTIHVFPMGAPETASLASAPLAGSDPPEGMAAVDLDRDGRTELVCFNRYDTAAVFRVTPPAAGAGATVTAIAVPEGLGRGLLTKLEASALSLADVDGDGKREGMVARKGYARTVALTARGIEVADQFNAEGGEDEVVAATALDTDGDGVPEVVLANKSQQELSILKRGADKVYRQSAAVPLPGFGLQGLLSADLTGDGKADLLAVGERRLALIPLGGIAARLDVLGLYEPGEERARLQDVVVGDLNGDGKPDIAVTEATEKHLALLQVREAPAGADLPLLIERAVAFPVFEQKAAEQRRRGAVAREMVVGDVTKDGKKDLLLLVHDRILLYPQG